MPEIIYGEQGSDEWHQMRVGSIGGSSITHVLAKGQGKSRKGLLYKLAAEILSGQKTDSYSNKYMDRGTEYEPEARACYELITGVDVVECAIIKADTPRRHHSPDGLCGDDGMIELKTLLPHVFVEQVDTGKIPVGYLRQCMNGLDVSGRQWIDFCCYSPEMPNPMWTKRITRDEAKIREMRTEVNRFLVELDELVDRLRQ